MDKAQILEFIRSNPGFHLATTQGDQPHVRAMFLFSADEEGIVFHTGMWKDVFREISANPKVELCFNNSESAVQVRVQGSLEKIDDPEFKKSVVNHPSRAFLKPIMQKLGEEKFFSSFAVFRLKRGKAHWWTLERNFMAREWVDL